MIKLELLPKPKKLTDELIKTKTLEFELDNTKSVWDIGWLKKAISDLSFGKCCYSEIRLGEESKYMEVEHFFPKDIYPDQVMQWGNLLPTCKKCNDAKGSHDTKSQPIVNPFVDNPKDYFYLENSCYCVRNNSEKARLTLDRLGLNDIIHFVKPRIRVSERIKQTLIDLRDDVVTAKGDYLKYTIRFKRLLCEGKRKEEYAALVSTTILSDDNYKDIESLLKEKKLWDNELQLLKEELEYCSLIR